MWRCRLPTGAGAYRRSCCRSCSASSLGSHGADAASSHASGMDGSGLGLGHLQGDRGGPRGPHPGRERRTGPGSEASPSPCPRWTSRGRPLTRRSSSSAFSGTDGAGPGKRARVLAVDDDPQALRYIRDVLTRRRATRPIVTGDPADVPRLMEEERTPSGAAGPGAAGHRRHRADERSPQDSRRAGDLPVGLRSGRERGLPGPGHAGASDYMVKPFSPTELAARIRAALLKPAGGVPRRADRILRRMETCSSTT